MDTYQVMIGDMVVENTQIVGVLDAIRCLAYQKLMCILETKNLTK